MTTQIVVALMTGTTALVVALAGVPFNYWITRRTKREQTRDLMAHYRDPLLWSAHDLRGRIRTILDEGFLKRSLIDGNDHLKSYGHRHTMFALAEYLGWVEILRRSIGFLDLGDRASNQKLVEHLSTIRMVLFAANLDAPFRVLNGEQRAIGELMIIEDHAVEDRGWRCIGFAEFCDRLDDDERFSKWFIHLGASVSDLAANANHDSRRLGELKQRLTELIDFLDPQKVRFPLRQEERSQYSIPRANVGEDREQT